MDSKSIFLSKTLWVNLGTAVFTWLATKYGITVDAQTQNEIIVGALAVANIGLRLITKQPVHIVSPS